MDINELTIGDIKMIQSMFDDDKKGSLNDMLGKKVIIRTYSAGVWFGELNKKSGEEVILNKARRMFQWWASESISLSAVAIHGIQHDKSKIVEAVDSVWLQAIEILCCTDKAIKSLEDAENVEAT